MLLDATVERRRRDVVVNSPPVWMFRRINTTAAEKNNGLVIKVYTKLMSGASSFKVISCSNTETVQSFCELCVTKFNIQHSPNEYELYSVEQKEDGKKRKKQKTKQKT